MELTKRATPGDAPDFDSLARLYRWMEYLSFGPILERCRFHFLPECVPARRALVLGDGDGRFTARLLAANANVQIDAVDSSAAMLAELNRRVQAQSANGKPRLRTIQADLRSFVPACGKYDLVVSHFFLDCLTEEEVDGLAWRIAPHLTPDAIWLVSEFSIPKKGWPRAAARVLVRLLYFAFDILTRLRVRHIPDHAAILMQSGFHRQRQARFLRGLLITEIWQREKI